MEYICSMKLKEFIEEQKPAEIAKALSTKQVNSPRDKRRLLNKVADIEAVVGYFGKEIKIEKKTQILNTLD